MPVGWIETPSNGGGGTDFFDLKKDGDSAIVVVMNPPFILDIHKLNDPTKQWGKMFPCGIKDRNACPVCEDTTGRYDDKERRTSIKCYYPAFVHVFTPKGGTPQKVDEMRVVGGGPAVHNGFMACYQTLSTYGGDIIGKPLIMTRTGEGAQTSFNIQAHPNPEFKVEVTGAAPDVEKLADSWLEKEWKAMEYDALASNPAQSTSKPGGGAEEPDPFDELAAETKKAA